MTYCIGLAGQMERASSEPAEMFEEDHHKRRDIFGSILSRLLHVLRIIHKYANIAIR